MEQVLVYECPHCGWVYINEISAYGCCQQLNVYKGYLCPDCGHAYRDENEAWGCCLGYYAEDCNED